MTLVELLVAMTITSIVLLGISSVVLVGYRAANLWSQQVTEAQTVNQLAGWLEQDVHRYVPCLAPNPSTSSQLQLCLPPETLGQNASVVYAAASSGGACPCHITRTDRTVNGQTIVARNLVALPEFQPECRVAASVDVGDVRVLGLSYPQGSQGAPAPSPPNLVVYFRAPLGSC